MKRGQKAIRGDKKRKDKSGEEWSEAVQIKEQRGEEKREKNQSR